MRFVIQEYDHDPEYPIMVWSDVAAFGSFYPAKAYLDQLREAEPDMRLRLVERKTIDSEIA
jgi:hypothetical protein